MAGVDTTGMEVVAGGKRETVPTEKSEAELAREKGAVVNEEGVVVDKRQLLSAGLNASKSATAAKPPDPRRRKGEERGRESIGRGAGGIGGRETSRERETRLFEEQLFGKSGGAGAGGSGDRETSRDRETRLFEERVLGTSGLDGGTSDSNTETSRERETRLFEQQLLGKRSRNDDPEAGRVVKNRKAEG